MNNKFDDNEKLKSESNAADSSISNENNENKTGKAQNDFVLDKAKLESINKFLADMEAKTPKENNKKDDSKTNIWSPDQEERLRKLVEESFYLLNEKEKSISEREKIVDEREKLKLNEDSIHQVHDEEEFLDTPKEDIELKSTEEKIKIESDKENFSSNEIEGKAKRDITEEYLRSAHASERAKTNGNTKKFGVVKYIAVLLALAVLGASVGFGFKYAGTIFPEKKIELKTSEVKRDGNVAFDEKGLSTAVSNIAEKYNPAVVSMVTDVQTYSGSQERVIGTGVVFSEDDESVYIVSNQHVVYDTSDGGVYERSNPIKVAFEGETGAVEAEVLGSDSLADLAVVRVEKKNIDAEFLKRLVPVAFADSDKVKVGEWVVAIGNPLGYVDTTTFGIVSGLDRKVGENPRYSFGSFVNLIQIDAAINSGNSGGATFNLNGDLIGINTMKIKETGVEGLGFAIASNDVKYVAEQILEKGQVERAFLGISGRDVGLTPGNSFGVEKGIHVIQIIEDTGAAKAGLKTDDVIIRADSINVETMEELSDIVRNKKIGEEVELDVIRKGVEEIKIKIKLGKRPNQN